eukprot:GSChrysophyteH1.ASY1.ANO1.556.1 assembled CDS
MSLFDDFANQPIEPSLDNDIVNLRKFDWSKSNHTIQHLAIGNNTIVAALKTCAIVRRNLDAAGSNEEIIEISKHKEDTIEYVFVDPSGHHTVVALNNGDNFYVHSRSARPKKFSRLQGCITSVAFDRRQSAEGSTKAFLVGTSAGCIYELCLESNGKEKTCCLLYTLPQPIAITALHFDALSGLDKGATNNYLVLAATSQPTRLYNFIGKTNFQSVFSSYANGGETFTELPGELGRAELLCYPPTSQTSLTQNFALMTQSGIYHGSILIKGTDSPGDFMIDAKMSPYGDQPGAGVGLEGPVSVASTTLHFFVLQYDRLLCISRLNGALVQEEVLSVADGNGLGLVQDKARNSMWMYTDTFLYQVVIINEDKYLWNIYLERALNGDERMFERAYEYCKQPSEKEQVMKARANAALQAGKVRQAALFFAHSGTSFEEVVMKLLGGHEKDAETARPDTYAVTHSAELAALRMYLLEEVDKLPAADKSQRTMLCTWLCELYLHHITVDYLAEQGDAVDSTVDHRELAEKFKGFLEKYGDHLDCSTTISLISSRGLGVHRELLLFYAQLIQDYDRIVARLVSDRLHLEALEVLDASRLEQVEQLIYKFAPILIQSHPKATVDMLTSKRTLKIAGLLPALLRYTSMIDSGTVDSEDGETNHAITFLQNYVTTSLVQVRSGVEVVAFTTLVWLLAKYSAADEAELCSFLRSLLDARSDLSLSRLSINYDYFLRQCKTYGRKKGVIYSYLLLGMSYEAVLAALEVDVELAKEVALDVSDQHLKKKLWLVIAHNAIRTDADARRALHLLRESEGCLKIEDLLPLLPDFTEIDLFKEDICSTLEDCSARIEHLQTEMQELSESAESISNELESMKKRGYSVSSLQRCEYCAQALFSRQFYLFPCSHGFHNDCLTTKVFTDKHLDSAQLEAVAVLESQIRNLAGRSKDDKRAMSQMEYLQIELDGYVAADCPLCGYVMIQSLSMPLVPDDQPDADPWRL